jgi:hypothetical protein
LCARGLGLDCQQCHREAAKGTPRGDSANSDSHATQHQSGNLFRNITFESRERALQQRLLPHLERTLALAMRLEGYRALQDASHQLLDNLTSGVLLLECSDKLKFANRAALSHHGGALLFTGQQVHARVSAEETQLAAALGAVLRGEVSRALRLTRTPDGRPVTIVISSVRGNDRDRFTAFGWRRVTTIARCASAQTHRRVHAAQHAAH